MEIDCIIGPNYSPHSLQDNDIPLLCSVVWFHLHPSDTRLGHVMYFDHWSLSGSDICHLQADTGKAITRFGHPFASAMGTTCTNQGLPISPDPSMQRTQGAELSQTPTFSL